MSDNYAIKFWKNWAESLEWMETDEQKAFFLLKVIRYAFFGMEPEIERWEGQSWEVIKTAIDTTLKGIENGSKGGRPNAQKHRSKGHSKEDDKTPSETPQKTPSKTPTETPSETPSETVPCQDYDLDLDYDLDYDLDGETRANANAPESFPFQCLAAFNEVMGATYGTLPSKVERFLERNRDRYTIEDVRAMVAYKRDEWQGTEFSRNLTPPTLFSPDHFEQYVHQSKMPKPTRNAKDQKGVQGNAELERIIGGIQASVIRA